MKSKVTDSSKGVKSKHFNRVALVVMSLATLAEFSLYADMGSCGSSKYQRLAIRDSFGGAKFGPACDQHDACYDQCGADKEACDREFGSNLRGRCNSTFRSHLARPARELCRRTAGGYESAVHRLGGDAFREAQEKCR